MDDDTKVFGRVMRLPGFDGMMAKEAYSFSIRYGRNTS